MSRDGSIEIKVDWADGEHVFRLAWGELIKLQEETDAGPYVVLRRLLGDDWRVQDISSTIRLGLVGGGMEPTKALKMVRDYVESRPPLENRMLAAAVLAVALKGGEDEPLGEAEAAPMTKESD